MNHLINSSEELQNNEVSDFSNYVSSMGLPIQNVLATAHEREVVNTQLSSIVNKISPSSKMTSIYLSRFAAAAYIGLFDAALNYVWDEVILRLRERVVLYGLDYFFDNAINNPSERNSYSDKTDLFRIRDSRFLEVCRNLEIVDSNLYRRLAHILDMRNYVSAAHPNSDNISGYELLSFVDICVTKVIELEFPQSVLDVRSLITRIKDINYEFDSFSLTKIEENCRGFGVRTTDSLFKTLFGIYVSNDSTNKVKEKCIKVCELIWGNVSDENKYDIGMKHDKYSSNLDVEKRDLTLQFLKEFDGLKYLSNSTKEFKLTHLISELKNAHRGWDNYYYEVPIIKDIMGIIKQSSDIPEKLEDSLINAIFICRVGNGNYGGDNGVSSKAKPYYDEFFSILNSKQIGRFLSHIDTDDYSATLYGERKISNFKDIMSILKSEGIPEVTQDLINHLLGKTDFFHLNNDKDYLRMKQLLKNYLD